MKKNVALYVFGEVLYDCFPDGKAVLGGAPFNVAWHLKGFGHNPSFISRVGRDEYGENVVSAMRVWGMDTSMIEVDELCPTGQVEVTFAGEEPQYKIVNNSAYDFISGAQIELTENRGILYHGSLCLRNETSLHSYKKLVENRNLQVFLDVNLRPPWWNQEDVLKMLDIANWAKMNNSELQLLAGGQGNAERQMSELKKTCNLEQIIVTRGEDGALIMDQNGKLYSHAPPQVEHFVDTVGAGDAFSSRYIHGLVTGLDIESNIRISQEFASKIVGIRGATTTDMVLYQEFI